VRAGLVRPARGEGGDALFGDAELARLRKIRRLRNDLGLNQAALELVLRLLDEIETLQSTRARHERRSDQL
jgi:MerR family transcriptional regulator/heat shock protein HspR